MMVNAPDKVLQGFQARSQVLAQAKCRLLRLDCTLWRASKDQGLYTQERGQARPDRWESRLPAPSDKSTDPFLNVGKPKPSLPRTCLLCAVCGFR